jgi:hypothetical protein
VAPNSLRKSLTESAVGIEDCREGIESVTGLPAFLRGG